MKPLAPGYALRRTRPGDLPQIPAIELAAAAQFRTQGLDGAYLDEATELPELEEAHAAGLLWVVTREVEPGDDTPVGYAYARPLDGALHLEEIDVHPDHGRRGLGAALVRTVLAEARARGYSRVTLRTFSDVPWNAPFYARQGFRALSLAETPPGLAALAQVEVEERIPLARRVAMLCEVGRE